MARRVKISTIGAAPSSVPAGATREALVKGAISYWQQQFSQVLPDQPDLIVVPEMCDSYHEPDSAALDDYYAARGDRVLEFFADTARNNRCYLTYPAIRVAPDGTRYNSLRLLDRQGEIVGTYDKNHVVINETENGGVYCGQKSAVFDCDFGRVACVICFDINFDELRLQYIEAKPDLMLFPSMFHGGFLQNYWAYSCRAHLVSAIGVSNLTSGIISPVGETIVSTTNYFNFATSTINLDCVVAHLDYNSAKLQALKAEYGPAVTIHDPGQIGSVLITSESDEVTVEEMISKFEIELLDDYLARSLQHHRTTGKATL